MQKLKSYGHWVSADSLRLVCCLVAAKEETAQKPKKHLCFPTYRGCFISCTKNYGTHLLLALQRLQLLLASS